MKKVFDLTGRNVPEMQREFDEMIEVLRMDAIAVLTGGHEPNRLQFLERLCDAGQGVEYPWGKWAAHTLAVAVLGGEEALTSLIEHMERWKAEHMQREAGKRLGRAEG